MRKAVDEERKKDPSGGTVGILCPSNADVLFERGGAKSNHYGNKEFACILASKLEEFCFNTKFSAEHYQEVIALVKKGNGRFLERDPDGREWWIEITDPVTLHKKIYSSMYELVKRLQARRKHTQSVMSESQKLSSLQYSESKRQKICHGYI